jgi:hypothetical protein
MHHAGGTCLFFFGIGEGRCGWSTGSMIVG